MRSLLILSAIALVFCGCRKEQPPDTPVDPRASEPKQQDQVPPEEPAEDDPVKIGAGIHDPRNAAELLPIAREVAKCDYDRHIDPRECPAFRKLAEKASALPPPFGFATLINLLEDESPALRFAAANTLRLRYFEGRPLENPEFLSAAKEALAAEEDHQIATELGGLVGKFCLEETGKLEEVLKLLRGHPLPQAQTGMLLHILRTNRVLPDVFEAVVEIAREDPDDNVKRAALAAFWSIADDHRDESVSLWREALSWPAPKASSHAAYMLGHFNDGVEEAFEDVLSETARRAEEGTLSWEFLAGLYWYVHNDQEFVDKARVFELLRGIAENDKLRWNVRNRAMSIMRETGDERFRGAIEPLVSEPETQVAMHAKRLLEEEASDN